MTSMFVRPLHLIRIFLSYTLVFVFMKVLFMLYNHNEYAAKVVDFFAVIFHGLPLDFSTAGYLTAFPLLLSLASCWIKIPQFEKIEHAYFGFTAFLLGIILCVDCALYAFWQFKLDATVFNYLDSPKEALASVSGYFLFVGIFLIFVVAAVIFVLLKSAQISIQQTLTARKRWASFGLILLLGGILFVFIRGGFGKSTMNIGAVYYSDKQFLNHAAVNPAFNLIYSSFKTEKFENEYRFFAEDDRQKLFNELSYSTESVQPDTLLNTDRPNVLFILMEGFGGTFIEPLGGEAGVTPQFNKLAKEGVFFTQCYANSFRTDRGTVCALSGYPSFPKISVMKIPEKSRTLASIARSLNDEGYQTDFLYGGDINFTNMKSYFLSTGYQKVVGDTHFPSSIRKTHAWGVTDRIAFDTLYNQVLAHPQDQPWFTTFLTLASHEPWVVPYDRIKNNIRTNAMAYTDDCLGSFIARLKKSPAWKNLLIICTADHGISYPAGLTEADIRRYHIPMLWLGGAVKHPVRIDKICNQSDLAATLLGQLQISHKSFPFSRDVVSKSYTYPCAMHTFDNGFAFIDSTGYTVQDFNSGHVLTDLPTPSKRRKDLGHTLLQTSIDELAKR